MAPLKNRCLAFSAGVHYPTVAVENALFDRLFAEKTNAASGVARHATDDGVIRIENEEIVFFLLTVNLPLGLYVLCQRFMPVEMIGANVQHDGHGRSERGAILKLKRAQLQHRCRA